MSPDYVANHELSLCEILEYQGQRHRRVTAIAQQINAGEGASMKRMLARSLTTAVAFLSVTSILSPASAAVDQEPGASSRLRSMPMTVGGIDDEAAARAGNRVVVDGNDKVLVDGRTGGELARVPVDPEQARLAATDPKGEVYGECGMSYFYVSDIPGDRNYEFWTGFELTPGPAYDFDWYVNVVGEWDGGTHNFDWHGYGPIEPNIQWSSGLVFDNSTAPPGVIHYGRVTDGTAWLTSGQVCFSGNPTDYTVVY